MGVGYSWSGVGGGGGGGGLTLQLSGRITGRPQPRLEDVQLLLPSRDGQRNTRLERPERAPFPVY